MAPGIPGSMAFLSLFALGRPLKHACISLCLQLNKTVFALHYTCVPAAMCTQEALTFFLCFEGGWWSLLARLAPRGKLWFIWYLQTDQRSLITIKCMIPDGGGLNA